MAYRFKIAANRGNRYNNDALLHSFETIRFIFVYIFVSCIQEIIMNSLKGANNFCNNLKKGANKSCELRSVKL